MAELYRDTDVVLKLGRFEGIGLAPLEAMHVGVPCVVTPFGGYDVYVEHGVNALVVGFDDIPGTARALDRLAEDRALLARLSDGALRTTESWPDPAASTAMLHDALVTLAAGEAEPALLEAVIRQTSPGRVELNRLHGLLEKRRQELDHERGRVEELTVHGRALDAQLLDRAAALEHCQRAHQDAIDRLDEMMASRAYRVAVAARKLLPGRR
jgi:hypothetical protein